MYWLRVSQKNPWDYWWVNQKDLWYKTEAVQMVNLRSKLVKNCATHIWYKRISKRCKWGGEKTESIKAKHTSRLNYKFTLNKSIKE